MRTNGYFFMSLSPPLFCTGCAKKFYIKLTALCQKQASLILISEMLLSTSGMHSVKKYKIEAGAEMGYNGKPRKLFFGIKKARMKQSTENLIYHKAAKCWECVNRSIQMFGDLLREKGDFDTADYYKARDSLRDAGEYFKETLKNAKKLLGPIPAYTTPDYQKWRDELLEEFHILAMSQEYEDLKSELFEDKSLNEWMDKESIELLLKKHFQTQQSGKRKLSNIKVRIILDYLEDLINRSRDMNKQAVQKQHS